MSDLLSDIRLFGAALAALDRMDFQRRVDDISWPIAARQELRRIAQNKVVRVVCRTEARDVE
jgi:hypothetical protein